MKHLLLLPILIAFPGTIEICTILAGQKNFVEYVQLWRQLIHTSEDQFKIDVGGYNPLLGKSYGEIAAESRSQHKSQGFGVPASRGEAWNILKQPKEISR